MDILVKYNWLCQSNFAVIENCVIQPNTQVIFWKVYGQKIRDASQFRKSALNLERVPFKMEGTRILGN